MPEGPEVKIISEFLNKTWKGRLIVSMGWDGKSKFAKPKTKIKGLELVVMPCLVTGVYSSGKMIVIECVNGNKESIYMISQLGMEGKWVHTKQDHSNFYLHFGGLNASKTSYEIQDTWYYDDSRHFGLFNVYSNLTEPFASHGPCMLTTALVSRGDLKEKDLKPYQTVMTYDMFVKVIRNQRIQNKEICDLLMEQHRIAGVGNYLRSEILYKCGFNPHKNLSKFNDNDIKCLYDNILELLLISYGARGLTIKSYWDPEGNKGTCPLQVYKQKKDPHGNPVEIEKDKQKRSIHWVPLVQTK